MKSGKEEGEKERKKFIREKEENTGRGRKKNEENRAGSKKSGKCITEHHACKLARIRYKKKKKKKVNLSDMYF